MKVGYKNKLKFDFNTRFRSYCFEFVIKNFVCFKIQVLSTFTKKRPCNILVSPRYSLPHSHTNILPHSHSDFVTLIPPTYSHKVLYTYFYSGTYNLICYNFCTICIIIAIILVCSFIL